MDSNNISLSAAEIITTNHPETYNAWRWTALAVGFTLCYFASFFFRDLPSLPAINYQKSEWTYIQAKWRFNKNAKRLIAQGFKKFSGPFTLVTDIGPLVMLPPEYIDAINQEPSLDFLEFIKENTLSKYDTFRSFRSPPHGLYDEVIMKGLTRSLPKFTKPLSDEMTKCASDAWGDTTEWHSVDLREDVLTWVARLSSRIFNGEELAANADWINISKQYTVNCFTAMAIVKLFPAPLQWIVCQVLPLCRTVRNQRKIGYNIIAPILKEREVEIMAAKKEDRKPNLPDDSIEWFRRAAKGRKYDDVDLQLGLSIAAIHTTSDLIGQSLLNLGAHPMMVEPLRNEAVEVLRKYGWSKVALTELRILDSFLKETQRMKPISMSSMHRIATKDIELPNGLKIRKGQRIAISAHRMWSESDYPSPERFDGFRFIERRKLPGYEHKSNLISTSEDHTAFSHGKHACPGRFFAANEVKIAMVHVLLKYDVRLDDPSLAQWEEWGIHMYVNTSAKMSVRRRKEEIDLDGIQ